MSPKTVGLMIVILILTSGLPLIVSADAGMDNWAYKKQLTIQEQSGNPLPSYPVQVQLNTNALVTEGKMRADCGDIRVVDESTMTTPPQS